LPWRAVAAWGWGAAAEVNVLGEAGSAVPKVVGDLAGGQAGVIKPVRHGSAEGVRHGPRKAGAVEGIAEVTAGVVRIAEETLRAGEEGRGISSGWSLGAWVRVAGW
jgi:hypothetical protein